MEKISVKSYPSRILLGQMVHVFVYKNPASVSNITVENLRHRFTNYDLLMDVMRAAKSPLKPMPTIREEVQKECHRALRLAYKDDPNVLKTLKGET